jgi:dephospho-CoA kinase
MVIGITGTNGAGKGTVVDYLKAKGFAHYSVREFLSEEVLRRDMPLNRTSMFMVGNDLRAQHGPGYLTEQLLVRAQRGGNAIIESIRSVGEADFLKSQGALLWAVDADRRLRYERISKRWSETDRLPFEQFVAEEEREFNNPDPTRQSLGGVIKMADAVFTNDGTLPELYQQVDLALKKAGVELG